MKNNKHSVKAANQLPSIDEQLNEVNNNLNDKEQEYLLSLQWLAELNRLVVRYSHLNISPDLLSMSLPELWGVYLWLKSLEVQCDE